MEGISWKRAYAGSLLVHLAVAGLLAVGLAGSVAQHEQEKMYVVDLDASELTDSGSGHAGGGGGGGSAESLFPDNYRKQTWPGGRRLSKPSHRP